MNLFGRYNMLRTAALGLIGVADDLETLKQMAATMRVPAMVDANAAVSLLLLQTLVATHGAKPEATDLPDSWVKRTMEWMSVASGTEVTEQAARDFLMQLMFGDTK